MNKYINCGKIVSTHGLLGELKVQPWTNDVKHLLLFSQFYLNKGERALKVTGSRVHKNMLLLRLEGIDSLEDARNLRGQVISLDRTQDPDDRPYLMDYIGLQVLNADSGQDYGSVTQILETGANDVFEVKDAGGRLRLVPDIPQVVLDTDFETRQMLIRPLEGLFDHED